MTPTCVPKRSRALSLLCTIDSRVGGTAGKRIGLPWVNASSLDFYSVAVHRPGRGFTFADATKYWVQEVSCMSHLKTYLPKPNATPSLGPKNENRDRSHVISNTE